MIVIEMTYKFQGNVSLDITVRLFGVKQARGDESSAPWDVSVTIVWGGEVAFDRPLSGADPLHAVELAAHFAASYIRGRAQDEGGTLEPPIWP
ncbi:hypothetical protein WMF04_37860 [Sorangium sp. So ce260]|uniref:hypothetical protein n=1 Tax=Sorangium sp. So ce260 TaxID=3133291 RepID=UPI003F61C06C